MMNKWDKWRWNDKNESARALKGWLLLWKNNWVICKKWWW